jgi:hypothetical protein
MTLGNRDLSSAALLLTEIGEGPMNQKLADFLVTISLGSIFILAEQCFGGPFDEIHP